MKGLFIAPFSFSEESVDHHKTKSRCNVDLSFKSVPLFFQLGKKACDPFLPGLGVVFAMGNPGQEERRTSRAHSAQAPGYGVSRARPPAFGTRLVHEPALDLHWPKDVLPRRGRICSLPHPRPREFTVPAGRGGPCRLALQRPRVAIATLAGLWTPEH